MAEAEEAGEEGLVTITSSTTTAEEEEGVGDTTAHLASEEP